MTIDLAKLREPFDESDVEWRVSRAGRAKDGGMTVSFEEWWAANHKRFLAAFPYWQRDMVKAVCQQTWQAAVVASGSKEDGKH